MASGVAASGHGCRDHRDPGGGRDDHHSRLGRARRPTLPDGGEAAAMTHRERGVAVVVAILIVALATSTASYILWHQSLWLRQVENLTARAQADALARAAAAWAAAILAEDDPAIDHLGEIWARRMPPFPAEHAELSGAIADEQAKFNLNNLAGEGGANAREPLPAG